MIPAPVHFCQSMMRDKFTYAFPLTPHEATSEQLSAARFHVMTGCNHEALRGDMIQWANSAVRIEGSNEVYLAVPHTGYCFYHNVTHLF